MNAPTRYGWHLWALALLALLLAACDESRLAETAHVRQQLVGTWLSESNDSGLITRTLIELTVDGELREFEKIIPGKGATREAFYSGEWALAGANFRRKYMTREGKPLPVNYFTTTTYAINLIGDDRFFGVDNLQHRTIDFRRVAAGTRP